MLIFVEGANCHCLTFLLSGSKCSKPFSRLGPLHVDGVWGGTGPAPGGGAFRGRAPPNECLFPPKWKLCPPKRGLCPEEINRLGATGVQIEAEIGVCHRYFRNFCGLTPDIWDEDLFFLLLEITYFRQEKPFKILISAGKSLWILVKTFFFWSSPCSFDPDWDKFLVPPCPSRIHRNKLLVPPQNLFLPPPPPVTLSWRRALRW